MVEPLPQGLLLVERLFNGKCGVVQNITTVVDSLPDNGETVVANKLTMQGGGKGSNTAVAIYRLTRRNPKNASNARNETVDDDFQVRMVGAVAEDEFGPTLRDNLAKHGINVEGVRFLKGQSTAVSNILVEAGTGANRAMLSPGAGYALKPTDFMTLESLGGGVAPDFIVISQLEIRRDTIEKAIETAYREGVEVLLNPWSSSYLLPNIYSMITHLVMNETEAVSLSDCEPDDVQNQTGWTEVAAYFHKIGVENVVVTLGEKGAYYSNESGSGQVEAEKNCTVINTSGAGDSFVGAYAAQYLTQKQKGQWDIRTAVQYGCKASARVIEHLGCLDSVVWADEVDIPRFSNGIEQTPEAISKGISRT